MQLFTLAALISEHASTYLYTNGPSADGKFALVQYPLSLPIGFQASVVSPLGFQLLVTSSTLPVGSAGVGAAANNVYEMRIGAKKTATVLLFGKFIAIRW
ncbi:hypothetical protein CVV68_10650 [Arthrobacter livingstonensis]|uniref:Uncharacterized protein n=1 Tax=Arthrobacter livingstonensis TaxID=670078 RepID=A0A2V5L741_9MICC|nr:hypothetical protein CVV68_10650 [Arthrobacter livingstonensis]